MDDIRTYRLAFGRSLCVREDDNDDDGKTEEGGLSQKDIDRIMSAVSGKLNARFKRLDKLEEQIGSILEERGSKAKAAKQVETESDRIAALSKQLEELKAAAAGGDKSGDSELPHGLKVKLEEMERSMAKATQRTAELESTVAEKDKKLVETQRKAALRSLLSRTNTKAHNPDDVIELILPKIVADDELGDALPWKTKEGGEDLVSMEKFVDLYADAQPYLFQGEDGKSSRGGSGSGGGRAPEEGKALTAGALAQDNMSWEEYEKNRSEILERAGKQFGRVF